MRKKSDPCTRAQKLYAKNDLAGSMEASARCIKQLTKMLRESQDKDRVRFQLARVYNFQGLVALQSRRLKKARESFNKAIFFIDKLDKNSELLGIRGEINYSMGLIALFNNQDPMEYFLSSKSDFIEAKEYPSAIKILFQLIDIKEDKFAVLKEIDTLIKKIKDKRIKNSLSGKSKLIAAKLLMDSDNKEAISKLKDAKKKFEKAKDTEGLCDVLITQAELIGDDTSEDPEEILLQALDLSKSIDSKSHSGRALTQLGILSLKRGDFKRGKERLLKGLKFRVESGDKDGAAKTLLELSRITLISAKQVEDMKNAEKFIQQSLELYTESGNEYGQAMSHELASTIYTRTQEFDKAVKHAKLGRKLFNKHQDRDAEARILAQLGVALNGNGDMDEVVPVFEKSIKLFREINSDTGVAEVNYLLGMHYLPIDSNIALEYMQKSLDIYERLRGEGKELEMMYNLVSAKIKEIS